MSVLHYCIARFFVLLSMKTIFRAAYLWDSTIRLGRGYWIYKKRKILPVVSSLNRYPNVWRFEDRRCVLRANCRPCFSVLVRKIRQSFRIVGREWLGIKVVILRQFTEVIVKAVRWHDAIKVCRIHCCQQAAGCSRSFFNSLPSYVSRVVLWDSDGELQSFEIRSHAGSYAQ